MTIPALTPLQFLVLRVLATDEHSGRFIRSRLAEEKTKMSLAAFYQLMARLETAGMIEGWYESRSVDGQTIKERKYAITTKGKFALKEIAEFYTIGIDNEDPREKKLSS